MVAQILLDLFKDKRRLGNAILKEIQCTVVKNTQQSGGEIANNIKFYCVHVRQASTPDIEVL